MKIIKINKWDSLPNNFTGIAEYPNGNKFWYKEGKPYREDGPAVEYSDGSKFWWIENYFCSLYDFQILIKTCLFLGKQKGKHNLDWLRFLIDKGIKEFPIIPGMEEDNNFKPLFNQLFGAPIK
jgi:hypothetical protein